MSELIKFDGLKDMAALLELLPERKKRMKQASAEPQTGDAMAALARALHPELQRLVIADVRQEAAGARVFRLVSDMESGTAAPAVFRAGQYLSLKIDISGVRVARPYSISSSPADAADGGFYEITIRKKDGGFLSEHAWKEWRVGTKIEASGPAGFFCVEPLRDARHIIGLAGGSGITPFRSMLKDIVETGADVKFTLLYGVNRPDEIMFKSDLEAFAAQAPDRINVHFVCCEPDAAWCGPTGFLTADSIRKLAGDPAGKSFFICGPQAMYSFLETELKQFELPKRRVRREVFGETADVSAHPDYPTDAAGKSFSMTVHCGSETTVIPANSSESALVALERAGIAPPSECRSGECGFCASILMNGKVFVIPETDRRRLAAKKFDVFHPCSSYPVTDIEVKVPLDKS